MNPYASYYFGYVLNGGHVLQSPDGRSALYADRLIPGTLGFPGAWDRLLDTGLLKNGKRPDVPDGRVYWTCSTRWFAFVWWDRSGDRRPNSNSGFYVYGFGIGQEREAFEFACAAWPSVVARQHHKLILQSGAARLARQPESAAS